jgi:hypothetical protein
VRPHGYLLSAYKLTSKLRDDFCGNEFVRPCRSVVCAWQEIYDIAIPAAGCPFRQLNTREPFSLISTANPQGDVN